MSNPYPANVLRPDGTVSQEGFVNFTDSENQPGGAWGQAATAAYVGSGSPVGVVTPSGEGDLYVDNTTPALWQATGDTSEDWTQVGGSGGLAISREITNLVFADAPTVIAYNAGPTLFGVAIADPPSFMDDASNITEAGIYVVGVKILVTNAPTIPGQYGLWESPDQITALPFPANQLDLGYLNLDSIVAITADDLPFALSNTINMQTDVSGTLQASGFVGQLASA